MNGRCENHPLDRAVNVCDSCFGEYCPECLQLPQGRRLPWCTDCMLIASGVRNRNQLQRRGAKKTAKARRQALATADELPSTFTYFDVETTTDTSPAATDTPANGDSEPATPGTATDATGLSRSAEPTEAAPSGPAVVGENEDADRFEGARPAPEDGRSKRKGVSAKRAGRRSPHAAAGRRPAAAAPEGRSLIKKKNRQDARLESAKSTDGNATSAPAAASTAATPAVAKLEELKREAERTAHPADPADIGEPVTPTGEDNTSEFPAPAPAGPVPTPAPRATQPRNAEAEPVTPAEPPPPPSPAAAQAGRSSPAPAPPPVEPPRLVPAPDSVEPPPPTLAPIAAGAEPPAPAPPPVEPPRLVPAPDSVEPPPPTLTPIAAGAELPVPVAARVEPTIDPTAVDRFRRTSDTGVPVARTTAPMIGEIRTIGGRRSEDIGEQASETPSPQRGHAPVPGAEALNGVEQFDAGLAPTRRSSDTDSNTDTDTNGNWIPPILRGTRLDQ